MSPQRNVTYRQCLKKGEARLAAAGIEEAANNAWLLFSEIFRISRARYYMDLNQICDVRCLNQYEKQIEQRASRIPLQHIIGHAPFMAYEFYVNVDVLTPRADTEVLVEQAFTVMKQQWQEKKNFVQQYKGQHISCQAEDSTPLRVLDMCTGSGCIAVSLACMAKEAGIACHMTAVDVSEAALVVAEKNNKNLCHGSVHLVHSNLFEALSDGVEFDIIVSNPPYIKSREIDGLMPEVREHEPRIALDGKEDGLYFYRKIAEDGRHFLKKGGDLLLEIGYDQGASVPEILENSGYINCRVIRDLAGLDRVVMASRK